MPNAVYIVLGSNYNIYQEYQLKFIQELSEQGYDINVFSIDSELPPASSAASNPNISLYRIQMKLTNENLEKLTKKIKHHVSSIDCLIIMDSIDFKGIKFGNELKRHMQNNYLYFTDSPVIHFISLEYENPIFNNAKMDSFDFTNFKLTSENFINKLKPFIKDENKLRKIDQQIEKQGNVYNQIQSFIKSPGFNAIFSDQESVKKILKEELMKYICNQIDLKKIGLQLKKSFILK